MIVKAVKYESDELGSFITNNNGLPIDSTEITISIYRTLFSFMYSVL